MPNKSIKKNYIMNAALTMSSFIFPLITFPYVSRILGPDGNGKVSFATSLISYFSIFAQMGIPTYGIRACAKVRDNKEELTRTAHELLMLNLIMDAVSYFVLFLALLFVPRLQQDKILYVIVSAIILLTSIGMEWLYKALEQYTYITIRSIIFKFIALVAMFLLIKEENDYIKYGAITIFASSASNILNLLNAHKYIGFKRVGKYNLRRHLKPVGIFFAMACATTIYTHLDVVMLGFMADDADVGYYHTAVRIKTLLVSIVTSLGTVLLPRASYYVQKGQIKEFNRISRKALNFVFLLSSPLVVYFIIYAKQGVYLLSGSAYTGAIEPMQFIMPTLLLIGITNILGIQILVPTSREKIVLFSEIFGAVVDVTINALLIPIMKSTGAAIGTLVAEAVVLVVQCWALRLEIRETVRDIHYSRVCAGILLGVIGSLWVSWLKLGNFITLLMSSILFFGIYCGYLLIKKEEQVVEIRNQCLEMAQKLLHRI